MLAQFCTEYQDNVLGDENWQKKINPIYKRDLQIEGG